MAVGGASAAVLERLASATQQATATSGHGWRQEGQRARPPARLPPEGQRGDVALFYKARAAPRAPLHAASPQGPEFQGLTWSKGRAASPTEASAIYRRHRFCVGANSHGDNWTPRRAGGAPRSSDHASPRTSGPIPSGATPSQILARVLSVLCRHLDHLGSSSVVGYFTQEASIC